MAGIDLTQLREELGNYHRANNKQIRPWIYKDAYMLQFMKGITKVQGEFPALNSVIDHVVQGFQDEWTELGDVKVTPNILKSYHQKVNFPIKPSQVLNSWIAEMYDKNLTKDQMPFSKYIMENELKPRITSDIETLLVDGEYDNAKLALFGWSMKGVLRVLFDGISDTQNPMYRIRLSAVPNGVNCVDIITEYEQKIPETIQRSIKKIFVPKWLADAYKLKYEDTYGTKVTYNDNKRMLTRLNQYEIVPYYTKQKSMNLIWATPEGNLLALRDDENEPKITDMQVQDYKLKIFMEFWLGVGFWSNQLVMVSTYEGSGSGLISDNETYYG